MPKRPKTPQPPKTNPSVKDRTSVTKKAEPYVVGYGRPPVEHQFKEGNNANPNGRPVGSKSQATVLTEQLQKKITITERGGAKRRITTLQAIVMTQINEALKGNQKAAEFLLKYQRQVEDGMTAVEEMDPDDQQALEILLSKELEKRQKAKK